MPQPDPHDRPLDEPARTVPRKPDAETAGGSESTSGWQQPDSTVKAERPGGVPARIGRFEVRAILGEGAFGRVYRGFDAELERDVAIKVPHGSAMTAGFRERFLREARAAATIHHPNVCPIYESGTDGEVPFLVIHFVAGPTLSALIERRSTPFPTKQAVIVVRKLALGVAAAHERGVVHRDLKPANILVDEVRREVLITDFGVARVGDSGQTVDGDVIGTPAYMSPEQAMGRKAEVGPLSDVYSLGVILYRLLAGRVPYKGDSIYEVLTQVWEGKPVPPAELRPNLDPRLNDLCLKAMAKEPKDRFPSAAALAAALENYLRARSPDESGEQAAVAAPTARPVALRPFAEPGEVLEAEAVEAELVFDLPTTARPMLTLMQAVAGAVLVEGLTGLTQRVADPAFAHDLAAEVVRRCRAIAPGGLAQMLGVTAGANIADAQVAAAQAAWEVAAQAPEGDRLALELYLGQLPDAVRKVFKRADDPTGATVPREFRAETPAALAEVLPRRVPRFRGGQALPGRADWVLVRWLGAGGFGEVWLAQNRRVPNLFGAVKFGLDLSAPRRKELAREARRAAQALEANPHPGLVPLLDTELGAETPWLMYEYVGGGDLADLVLAWHVLPAGGRVRAVIERLREVTEAVAALHQLHPPVVHRDLKPSNVLRDPHTFRLRVTDFGVGAASVEGQLGRRRGAGAPELRGAHSLLYASPQQLNGDRADPRDDVHALGVLGFQMLTGRLTTGVPTDYDRILRALNVPPALVRLIGDCTASDARTRPRDAGALAALLAAQGQPTELPRARVADEHPKPAEPVGAAPAPLEVLMCPGCKARLQVEAGRTQPVACPRCSHKFAPAAGRVVLKAKPLAPPPEPLSLDADDPEPTPPPRAKPRRPDRSNRRDGDHEKPKPRRSFRRLLKWSFVLFVLGAGTLAGVLYEDELTTWVAGRRAKPVEFPPVREFEPGADTARVYALFSVNGAPALVLTNSDRKDVFAAVWNLKTGKRECVLKGGPPLPTATLDPKITQFRYDASAHRLVAFNRDQQALDRGGVWVYKLPEPAEEVDAKDEPPKKMPDKATEHEALAVELGPRRRTWDVNHDLTRAVGEPKGGKVQLWNLLTGTVIDELSVGTTFRAIGFSPDGSHVVGLCDQSWLRRWNADTGKPEDTDAPEKAGKADADALPRLATRLAARPAWEGTETGTLAFDAGRVIVTTDTKVGSWDARTGAVVEPMKKLGDGVPLKQKYRLRAETGGRGTFSVFNDEFTLRASKLSVAGGGDVTSWCLSDDRAALAAASNRKVQVWKLKYPAP